jgi:hypothetical protein
MNLKLAPPTTVPTSPSPDPEPLLCSYRSRQGVPPLLETYIATSIFISKHLVRRTRLWQHLRRLRPSPGQARPTLRRASWRVATLTMTRIAASPESRGAREQLARHVGDKTGSHHVPRRCSRPDDSRRLLVFGGRRHQQSESCFPMACASARAQVRRETSQRWQCALGGCRPRQAVEERGRGTRDSHSFGRNTTAWSTHRA